MKTESESGRIIAILGASGSGKTTFSDHLAREIHGVALHETVEGNPFIRGAHQQTDVTFQNQTWFFLQTVERWERATQLRANGQIAVMDTYAPTELLHSQLVLNADSLQLYNHLSDMLTRHLPSPDLLIYLYDSKEFLMQRLKKRNLAYDDGTEDFADRLQHLHELWLPSSGIPYIRIQSRLVEKQAVEKQYVGQIKKTLAIR